MRPLTDVKTAKINSGAEKSAATVADGGTLADHDIELLFDADAFPSPSHFRVQAQKLLDRILELGWPPA